MPWKQLATIALTVVTAVLEEQNKKKQSITLYPNGLDGGSSTITSTISTTTLYILPLLSHRLLILSTNHKGVPMSVLHPLTDNELLEHAPTLFTEEPHYEVSDKYHFIPTIDVITKITQ